MTRNQLYNVAGLLLEVSFLLLHESIALGIQFLENDAIRHVSWSLTRSGTVLAANPILLA